jgi:NAD-dependent dihydropyrimidine dehydrogenase PreA subunit
VPSNIIKQNKHINCLQALTASSPPGKNRLKIGCLRHTFPIMKKTAKKGKFRIEIIYEQCGNCGACVAVCPENVLHLTSIMLIADNDECTGCKYCIITCPSDALKLHKKGGKADD